jgi:glycosyltransferase involved in cell wall biosynthesis
VICSRLAREKNILPMISVFSRLVNKGYKSKLVIIGDGPQRMFIHAHCVKEGIKDYQFPSEENAWEQDVICVGQDSNPYKYIRNASFFMMASESEGFPNSLVESMVLGVPVIAADCPWGPREILAPDLEAPLNSIAEPLQTSFGVLMPMLKENDDSIQKWSDQLFTTITETHTLSKKPDVEKDGWIFTPEKMMGEWKDIIHNI